MDHLAHGVPSPMHGQDSPWTKKFKRFYSASIERGMVLSVDTQYNVIQVIFDNLRSLEAEAGRQQLQEFSLEGNVEADATCIRKCPVSARNCHFADEVSR